MHHSSGKHIADYLKPGCHAHLVGIGGVSMRPLGLVLRSQGLNSGQCRGRRGHGHSGRGLRHRCDV